MWEDEQGRFEGGCVSSKRQRNGWKWSQKCGIRRRMELVRRSRRRITGNRGERGQREEEDIDREFRYICSIL
jgi:hypothetical protein